MKITLQQLALLTDVWVIEMIGNITKGNNFYLCVAYVLDKEAQLINSNMASSTPTDLAWEFRKFTQLNQRVQKPVLHISLSPAPGDRILDEWELCMIAQDLLEGLELSNNQFILVQHNDTEYEGKVRPHVHLVINRVSHDGKCNDDYLDYYRTEKILRQIEKDYNLIHQPSSWEVDKKKAYPKHVEKAQGELNVVERLQNAIEGAAVDKPEMPVFVARLLKDKIQVNCKFTRTGKLKGISYCMDGEAFKGGDLGKLYTHIGIRKHLGVGYQQYYSNPISSLMESYKRGYTIDDEWVERLSYWCLWRNEELDINNNRNEESDINNKRNEKLDINNKRNEELDIDNNRNEELDINNNRNEESDTNISISSYVNGNHESAQTPFQSEAITPVPQPLKQEQHIAPKIKVSKILEEVYSDDKSIEETQPSVIKPVPQPLKQEQHIVPSPPTPTTSEQYSNPDESNSQIQPEVITPSFFREEGRYVIPTTQSPSTSDDIYPEIITDTTNYLDIKVEATDTVTQSQEQFQEQYAINIANTVLLMWQQYSFNSKNIRGKNYDLQLGSEDVILVKRKSGETIAEIPLDGSKQPRGIALTSEDISNWNATQHQIEAHLEGQPASRTKRRIVKDEELD